MNARTWLVLMGVITLVSTSGCGSARWGYRHSRLPFPSACVSSPCGEPSCELCSPLPPLYEGMSRNHRLNRIPRDGHAHGRNTRNQGRHGECESCKRGRQRGCPTCGHANGFNGEVFDGEIVDGGFGGGFYGGNVYSGGGCSGCSSCGGGTPGMSFDGGMHQGMVYDGGMMSGEMPMSGSTCQSCQNGGMAHGDLQYQGMEMSGSPEMMHGQMPSYPQDEQFQQGYPQGEAQYPPSYDPQPTPAGQPGSTPTLSTPVERAPMQPSAPMDGGKTTMNYGAALFGTAPGEPRQYVSGESYPEQAMPVSEPQHPTTMAVPPLAPPASPVSHTSTSSVPPMDMTPPALFVPALPGPQSMNSSTPSPSDYYSPKHQMTNVQVAASRLAPESPAVPALPAATTIGTLSSAPAAPPMPIVPAKKPMRPFSEAAKPRTQAPQQPNWDASLNAHSTPPEVTYAPPFPSK